MFRDAIDHDSVTVLVVPGPGLSGVAEPEGREGLGETVVRTAEPSGSTPRGILDRTDVDCVVVDAVGTDEGPEFARRIREVAPSMPLVVRTSPTAGRFEQLDLGDPHTDVLWARDGDVPVEELAARIDGVIDAATSSPTDAATSAAADPAASTPADPASLPSDRTDKTEALHAAATDIQACHTEEAIYEETVRAAERILEFDTCCTMVHDDGMLRPKAVSEGAPPDGARPMDPDEGEAGHVFQTGEPRVSADILDEDIADPAKETYRASLSVPIRDVGVFQAVASEPGVFSRRDVELAELLVSHTAAAIDRLRFEEKLQAERDRFRALVRHSTDLITVLSGDGTIRYQSPSIEHILGYADDETVGESAFEYVHPDDRDQVVASFERVLEHPDETLDVEYRIRNADDEWRVFESIGTNHLEDAAVEGFVVNSRDVTDRKERLRILEKLPGAAEDVRDAADAETIAEITVSTTRNVLGLEITGLWLYEDDEGALVPVASTPESAALFGDHPTYTPDGESLSWQAFETGEDRITDDVRDADAVYNPETAVRSEMILTLGEYGVINIGTRTRETFDDVEVYFARIFAAMAESALERVDHEGRLRRQQRELERQNERLEDFASFVSHDLRNPIGIARGYVGLLAEADTQADVDQYAGKIDNALDRMETLVEDVLALTREGETVRDPRSVALATVARSAWRTVATGDADLETPDAVPVEADEDRLKRLLENLVRNAIEHGDADRVRIGALRADGDLEGFYVSDDGPGIPESEREAVFETGHSTASEGTGLGLRIVEEIADAHGWSVAVTTGDLGGARYEVTGVSPG
jgi:PAS domain S-box-containing protein